MKLILKSELLILPRPELDSCMPLKRCPTTWEQLSFCDSLHERSDLGLLDVPLAINPLESFPKSQSLHYFVLGHSHPYNSL